jgi:hypothetical protein
MLWQDRLGDIRHGIDDEIRMETMQFTGRDCREAIYTADSIIEQ